MVTSNDVAPVATARNRLLTEGFSLIESCDVLKSGLNERASIEDVFFCFRLLLGRPPNPEEVPGHMSAVGQDLKLLVMQYLKSGEFDRRDMLAAPESGAQLVHLHGYDMIVDPDDQAVGKGIVAGHYEDHVACVVRDHVKAGDTVIDIGANMGFFAMLAAHLVGKDGRVFAIEPNVANCRLLEASRQHNHYDHVTIHAVAATDVSGPLVLNSAYSNGSVSSPSESFATLLRSQIVPGVVLDDLLRLDRLDFVKIDVEGFELSAMTGLQSAIDRFAPMVVSEFSPTAMPDSRSYIRFYSDRGYSIGIIQHDGSVEDKGNNYDAIMDFWKRSGVDHIDILATPPRDVA